MSAGNTSLTTEQQIARLRFEALVADIEHADALYDALPESQGGRVISTDIARYLDLTFHVHTPGRLRDLVPSWEGAWRYAQGRLYRELMRRKKRKVLRLMAGGWASGKTYALSRSRVADLTWDGTLSDLDWASQTIELALKHGWNVEVAYVQRPVLLALQGSLERGVQEGRMVPLWELPAVHAKVQSSILALHNRFGLQSRVRFLLLYNPGTIERPQEVLKIAISDIASGGRLHYSTGDVKGFPMLRVSKSRPEKSGKSPAATPRTLKKSSKPQQTEWSDDAILQIAGALSGGAVTRLQSASAQHRLRK